MPEAPDQGVANGIPSWVTPAEHAQLAELAAAVRESGLIVEIGSLYGGTTATLALAAPDAHLLAIDEFSWSPLDDEPASEERLRANLSGLGIHNVEIMAEDSRKVGSRWMADIDLLFIDGGHSYEFVKADLAAFGPHAKVIACHDFDNPFWPDIRRAVDEFIAERPGFRIVGTADTLVTIERWGSW